jgi:hypothetical protein
MLSKAFLPLLALSLAGSSALAAEKVADKVALRTAGGRFMRAGDDGSLRATSPLVGDNETFDLVSRGKDEIALIGPGGRAVMPDARDPHTLLLGPPGTLPGAAPTFQLVPSGTAGFALRPKGGGALIVFDPSAKSPAPAKPPVIPAKPPSAPLPRETVEIFRLRPLPAVMQNTLSSAVDALAAEQLAGKQYDQTRTEHTNKRIELPAPTLKDPRRKTKVQVLAMTEEYHVQAKLDGKPEIHIPSMLFLSAYVDGGPSVVLVAVDAKLPVSGHVQARIHDVGSAGTGYRAAIGLSAVAAVEVRRAGGDAKLGPCTVTDLHVSFARLDLSNDILEAARRPIKNFINRELHRNEDRLRQSANQSLQKAISSRQVRIPLLGYLGVL